MENTEYKFPDEAEQVQIEIEDDVPAADKDKEPIPKETVEELDRDELDEYSNEAKEKLAKFRRIYHDERREKEKALREQQEAISLAQKLYEENKALKGKVNSTERVAVDSYKNSAEHELEMAKREYREAYESGDSEKLVDAQEKMTSAKMKVEKASNYAENINQRASLQERENEVQIPQQTYQQPTRDQKASAWQERNSWFGQDDEMTSLALGLHEKLVKENGMAYATTDEYYRRIDDTMRKRFPENFQDVVDDTRPTDRVKPSTVVAPASRSTSSKKIRLNTSQLSIAKKLGLTPEQYARELLKMES
jgi:hypothetical protein